mmetsp:Transcript_8474/g.31365  ORF Transcript_8474/g.31365 Transcript_8474/m.31365 type:complete len:88 (-) Transcript_8474:111-374(-)
MFDDDKRQNVRPIAQEFFRERQHDGHSSVKALENNSPSPPHKPRGRISVPQNFCVQEERTEQIQMLLLECESQELATRIIGAKRHKC